MASYFGIMEHVSLEFSELKNHFTHFHKELYMTSQNKYPIYVNIGKIKLCR